MNFLRSSLFISILSLLLLTGYASHVSCDCLEDGHPHEMTAHGESAPETGDDCQCICHQMVSDFSSASMQLEATPCVALEALRDTDQFPPDAVPLGIEYPPQRG